MAPLHMRGRQINSICRFYEYFSLEEILTQREAFSAFARAQLRLGEEDCYFAEMFRRAALETPLPESDFADDYWDNPLQLGEEKSGQAFEPAAFSISDEKRALTHTVYERVAAAQRDPSEKRRLYFLAASALLLGPAQTNGIAFEAESLFRLLDGVDRSPKENEPAERTVAIADQTEVVLTTGKTVYWLETFQQTKLGEGQIISNLRVTAKFGPAAGKYSRAILRLRGGQSDATATEFQLQAGEHLDFLCADGCVIKPLPTKAEAGSRSLTRPDLSKDDLVYRSQDGTARKLSAASTCGVTAFCVEPDADGYLLILGQRLDASHFSCYHSYPQLQQLEHRSVVDVMLHEEDFLVLQNNGRVFSSRPEWDSLRNVAALEDVIGKKRM